MKRSKSEEFYEWYFGMQLYIITMNKLNTMGEI